MHLQVGLIRAGKGHEVVQETRGWDEAAQVTRAQRSKEGLADYRYFPEPDLPLLVITEEYLAEVQASLSFHQTTRSCLRSRVIKGFS